MKGDDIDSIELDMMEFKAKPKAEIEASAVLVAWLMGASIVLGIWVGITNQFTPRAIAMSLGISSFIIFNSIPSKHK